jgi:hypothetical protein
MAMAIPAPETSLGLVTVDPDVTESLAVVAIHETGLCLICFDFYNDVTGVGKREDWL